VLSRKSTSSALLDTQVAEKALNLLFLRLQAIGESTSSALVHGVTLEMGSLGALLSTPNSQKSTLSAFVDRPPPSQIEPLDQNGVHLSDIPDNDIPF
jgi:hypothetical protein